MLVFSVSKYVVRIFSLQNITKLITEQTLTNIRPRHSCVFNEISTHASNSFYHIYETFFLRRNIKKKLYYSTTCRLAFEKISENLGKQKFFFCFANIKSDMFRKIRSRTLHMDTLCLPFQFIFKKITRECATVGFFS